MKMTDQRFSCSTHSSLAGESIWSSSARKWVAAILLFSLSAANVTFAQVYTHETYGQELDKTTRVQPLDHSGQFGEMVDLNSGSVSFRKTVVEVPGNSKLRVSIDYALNLKTNASNAPMYYWDRELPYIEGVHGKDHGWVVGVPGNYSGQRCSHSSAALGAPVIRSTKPPINNFNREEYWNGNSLVVPGGEGGVIRPIDSDEPRPSGMDVRWATNSGWRFTCYQLENGSEGFVGHSQNGDKLYFGAPVADTEVFQVMNSFAPYNDTWVEVVSYRMYLTRIEDRFGNWVKYEPHQVTSNDGRIITIERSGSNFIYKENGRTWTVSGSNILNPDGSSWSLVRSGQFGWVGYQQAFSNTCRSAQEIPSTIGGGVSITITTESGARGVFRVEPRRHGYSYVPYRCYVSTPPYGPGKEDGHNYPDQLHYMDQVSLVSRSVEGSGVQPYQEVIDYGQLNACYSSGSVTPPDQCQSNSPTTKTVTLTRSDGLVRKFVYGNKWGQNAGLLLSEQIGSARRTDRSYVFLNDGIPRGSREYGKRQFHYNVYEYKVVRVKNTTVSQQGTSFVYNVDSFDSFARPTRVTRYSNVSGSPVKTELIAYHDNLSRWVLGQPSKLTVNGIVVSETGYSSYAQPLSLKSYGKLQWVRTHDVTTAGQKGTIKTINDGNGNITTLTNWKRGIPQSIAYADGTTQSAVVNDAGWITRVTDENGFATNYAYDPMGRLSKITYPTGDSTAWNTTTFSFAPQPSGSFGLPAGFWRQDISTGNYRKHVYFDALWRPVMWRDYEVGNESATGRFQRFSYDHEGRVTFTSYASGSAGGASSGTWSEYDALGRVTSVTQDSEHGPLTTLTEYLSGFRTRVTNPKGHQTLTRYMAWDQPTTDYPVAIAHSQNTHTDIARDVFGKPTAVTRRNSTGSTSVTRRYVYGGAQRLCIVTEPETGSTVYGFNGAGLLAQSAGGLTLPSGISCAGAKTQAWASGHRVDRTYDARNRIRALTFPDGRGNTTYSYTPDGLLKEITADRGLGSQPVVTTAYTYNKRRLPTGEALNVGSHSWGLGYGYNANGHLQRHVLPGGLTVDYAPNALGQPTQAGTYAKQVTYFPNGAIRQFTYGNGIVHTLAQNERGLPEQSRNAYSSTVVHDDGILYDRNGNVAEISDGLPNHRGNRVMTYDVLDRLTQVTSPMFGTATYAYSVLDNLNSLNVTGGSKSRSYTYGYDANRRLNKITSGGSTVATMTYDDRGNLASKNGTNYYFSHGNQLRSVGSLEGYYYDGHGRRVWARNGSGDIYSFYGQDGTLHYQRDEREGKAYEYIHLGGSLVARLKDGIPAGSSPTVAEYYHTDALGSVVAVTAANRGVVERREYEPYGLQLTPAPRSGPGYTGHVQDTATGLVYMQQRYYDPMIGRFLSVDPVRPDTGSGANFNRYWYANNNPYKFTDPDGRQSLRGGSHPVEDREERIRISPPPPPPPTRSNESIDMVIEKYNIRTNGASRTYEPGLKGVDGANPNPGGEVWIGPNAFKSESYLGQVVGHEFRHEQQRAEGRHSDSTIGGAANEAEAYLYNIKNASRFNSQAQDIADFTSQFEKYYNNLPADEKRKVDSYDYSTP